MGSSYATQRIIHAHAQHCCPCYTQAMSEVLLFTGPPGAGKSTAAEQFTSQRDEAWAYIDQDEVRKQVKAGFRNPSEPWNEETQKQWDVSVDICADMARRYQAVGINCLIDCFMPPHAFGKWEKAFKAVRYQVVVLLPDVEMALIRNNQRSGQARLREEQVRQHHEWFTGYRDDDRVKVIDSSALSVDGVSRALNSLLDSKIIGQVASDFVYYGVPM